MIRTVPAALVLMGVVVGGIGLGTDWLRPVMLVAGLGLGALLTWAWRETMRPRSNAAWWIIGIVAVLLAMFAPDWAALPIGLTGGTLAMLDDRRSPGAILAGGLLLTSWRGGRFHGGEAEAWWIALGGLLVLVATIVERERLARPLGRGATLPWNLVRIGIVTGWTLTILLLHGAVHPAAWLPTQVIDPGRISGRIFLAAVMVAALLGAAALWGQRRRGPTGP